MLLLSRESGAAAIGSLLRRQLRARGVAPEAVEDRLRVECLPPNLTDSPGWLPALIRRHRTEVVIIDPAYILIGGPKTEWKDLADAGRAFQGVVDPCISLGCTPIIVDHTLRFRPNRTGAEIYEPIELDDIRARVAIS